MTEAEIARATSISQGAVKSTASRALDKMERLMAEYRPQHFRRSA
jgi:DNA-directed RNA polymerase specialized sigma24 family protein